MVAALKETRRYRRGSRVPLLLERGPEVVALPSKDSRLHGAKVDARVITRPAIEYYLLHTRYTRTGAARDSYDPIMLELGVQLDRSSRAFNEGIMVDALGTERVTIPTSGRAIWSPARLNSGSTDTDGLILAARLRGPTGKVEQKQVIGETTEWSPRVPYAVRSQDLRDLLATTAADSPARPTLEEAIVRSDREGLESWDTQGRTYIGKEGLHQPALVNGGYDLGVSCLQHLQPWDSWDRTNFRVTEGLNPQGADADVPQAIAATNRASRFDVFMLPQYLQYTVQWWDIYVIGTLWFYSLVAIPNTGVFCGPLPVLPKPYAVAGPTQNAANGVAVSRYVERTNTYARMIVAGNALNTITPFFFIFLVARIGGRVLLTQRTQPAGALCAVVDHRVGDGPALRRYVWRKTPLVRDEVPFDFVALNTNDVVGADRLFVDGNDTPVLTF